MLKERGTKKDTIIALENTTTTVSISNDDKRNKNSDDIDDIARYNGNRKIEQIVCDCDPFFEVVRGEEVSDVVLSLEYDGTNYNGWQRQGIQEHQLAKSVQGALEYATAAALSSCSGKKEKVVMIQASGRTDKGVHALDQRCVLRVPRSAMLIIESSSSPFLAKVNSNLPEDIAVLKYQHFLERKILSIRKKRYTYIIQQPSFAEGTLARPNAELHNYTWYLPQQLNLEAIKTAMKYLEGFHDFNAVSCKTGRPNTCRTILHADAFLVKNQSDLPWFEKLSKQAKTSLARNNFIVLEFEGDGFLKHQVRQMVSVIRKVGEEIWPPESMSDILQQKEGSSYKKLPSAPSRGLWLERVWTAQEI